MAEHQDQHSGQATKGVGGAEPRQHNETSTGRGAGGSAPEVSRRSVVQPSTSGGRASSESDREAKSGESGSHRPSHPAQPDEMPLTLGSNGGGREDQPAGTDAGRQPHGTEAHPRHRKAS